MNLIDEFRSLSQEQKRRVHLALCEPALKVWDDYVSTAKKKNYVDSIVGLRHNVEMKLPNDAFKSVIEGRDLCDVDKRYQEPLAALQDHDLEFPGNVRFAYYAIYNLFQRYVARQQIDDWLIINQALSSQPDMAKAVSLLHDVMGHKTVQ